MSEKKTAIEKIRAEADESWEKVNGHSGYRLISPEHCVGYAQGLQFALRALEAEPQPQHAVGPWRYPERGDDAPNNGRWILAQWKKSGLVVMRYDNDKARWIIGENKFWAVTGTQPYRWAEINYLEAEEKENVFSATEKVRAARSFDERLHEIEVNWNEHWAQHGASWAGDIERRLNEGEVKWDEYEKLLDDVSAATDGD